MVIYIDSSFLLNIIFEEDNIEISKQIWKDHNYRVSSIILNAECLVTLRRFYKNEKNKLEKNWLTLKEKELFDLSAEVNTRVVDERIIEYIKLKKELSNCRTLDAIHLATGLEFKDNLGTDVKICTYDERMKRLAGKLHLSVLPKPLGH